MPLLGVVTPEYNYRSPPALVNTLDHLYVEWNYKVPTVMLNELVRWTDALQTLRRN